jgi:hypothetical protein
VGSFEQLQDPTLFGDSVEWAYLFHFLGVCTEKAYAFIGSHEMVNREQLQGALDAIVERTGHFDFL